ncbi:MAG TPA: YjgP/YjgQ family permease [bacterium]|nr:YjgP/YjgQ family permease [bacterium]
MRILTRYLVRQFTGIFLLCLAGVILIFLVVDVIENMDGFIDARTPARVTAMYYLYFIPMIVVLILPVATLLAAVFSVGILARNNEMVAFKALGVSLYQVMAVLLTLGFVISAAGFLLSEGVAVPANRKKQAIADTYLKRSRSRSQTVLHDLKIQEPPNRIVFIGRFDRNRNIATRVKIGTFEQDRLISRIDASAMTWKEGAWVIESGYRREFTEDEEFAEPIGTPLPFRLAFTPDELVMAQSKPDEMNIRDLNRFIRRIVTSGQPAHPWVTEFHLRIAFPLANILIVLLSAPLAYNRRKQNLALGFGFALGIVFLYFGLVKLGQTLGHNGTIRPLPAAWLGNGVAVIACVINLSKIRK